MTAVMEKPRNPPLLVKRIGERFLRTLEFLLSKSTNSPFTLEMGGGRKGKDPAWRGIDSLISRVSGYSGEMLVEVIINRSMPGRDSVNRLSAWKTWKLGKAGKMDDSEIPEISLRATKSRIGSRGNGGGRRAGRLITTVHLSPFSTRSCSRPACFGGARRWRASERFHANASA